MAESDPTQPVGDSSAQHPEPGAAPASPKPAEPSPALSPQAAAKATAAEAALAAAQAAIDSLNLGTELPDLSSSSGPDAEAASGSVTGRTARPETAMGRQPGVVPAGTATGAMPLELPSLSGEIEPAAARAIDLLSDVNLHVKIELGRTRMYVEDVLKLSEGAVVELDKLAGDPVDIFVNDRHIARGEVLVLNDNFCVRIHEIIKTVEGKDHAKAG